MLPAFSYSLAEGSSILHASRCSGIMLKIMCLKDSGSTIRMNSSKEEEGFGSCGCLSITPRPWSYWRNQVVVTDVIVDSSTPTWRDLHILFIIHNVFVEWYVGLDKDTTAQEYRVLKGYEIRQYGGQLSEVTMRIRSEHEARPRYGAVPSLKHDESSRMLDFNGTKETECQTEYCGDIQHNVSHGLGFEQEEEDAHVNSLSYYGHSELGEATTKAIQYIMLILHTEKESDDKDKDQDPSAGSDRGTKRRKSSKEAESQKDLRSLTELEYHFEECSKATTENNSTGITLKASSIRSIFTKAATYEVQWIEDMVPNIWSPVKVVYDKHAYWVTSLKIMKRYDYGYLDEIEVRREDHQLYKFKEGDFPRLRLQDIEDMLLLLVQQKLTNLTIDEIFDLNVALRMFTRRIVIQRRVEDLQLGVKSYQKKLNLTKLDTFRSNLRNKTAYTTYSNPQGVIYKDQNNRNRLMRTDELHKFSDGTLNYVRTALHDITSGIRMEYLPKRKWSGLDKQRARVMIQDIDKQLFQRRLMRNLKKFVGGREYGEDLRLLERTI
ncbi:hypothetical protein Tco_1121632 [Tanacetum coccineum]|uniref:Uncharacterized protein n=1 Tax=Tanacetum coccineum TaxID=301880 RepID=A0ABQ5IY76_9ASTR